MRKGDRMQLIMNSDRGSYHKIILPTQSSNLWNEEVYDVKHGPLRNYNYFPDLSPFTHVVICEGPDYTSTTIVTEHTIGTLRVGVCNH